MSANGTPLAGKVAIVTGSGRGLGLAYAAELARQGASVVVNDVDADTAAAAVASIEAEGGKAVAVVAPVGSTETAQKLVATAVESFGGLDILVTNAGVLRDKVLWKMSDDDFDTVIGVHLRGTFTCVREAATYMRENGVAGRIICIGSPTGQRGNFGQTNYAAAKAGIVGMVRTWALEMQARRRHGQHGRSGCRDGDDRDGPVLRGRSRGRRRRRADAGVLPQGPGLRHRGRRGGAGRVPRLGCAAGDHRSGDRRRRRPHPALVPPRAGRHGYRDGGWSADARRGRLPAMRGALQPSARSSRRCPPTSTAPHA